MMMMICSEHPEMLRRNLHSVTDRFLRLSRLSSDLPLPASPRDRHRWMHVYLHHTQMQTVSSRLHISLSRHHNYCYYTTDKNSRLTTDHHTITQHHQTILLHTDPVTGLTQLTYIYLHLTSTCLLTCTFKELKNNETIR